MRGPLGRVRALPFGYLARARYSANAVLTMGSARPILDTLSALITEDTHLLILLSALTAAAVALITMRRW